MSEDSLLERVTAAAEERHLSQNTLTAYRRTWLKLIALSAAEGFALETLPEDRAGEFYEEATRGRSASHDARRYVKPMWSRLLLRRASARSMCCTSVAPAAGQFSRVSKSSRAPRARRWYSPSRAKDACSVAAPSAAEKGAGINQPLMPGRTMVGMPPTSAANAGTPKAAASHTAMPKASAWRKRAAREPAPAAAALLHGLRGGCDR